MSDSFWDIPGHSLIPIGSPPGLEEFRMHFDRVWQVIPQAQKNALAEHWTKRGPLVQVIYETAEFFQGPHRPAFYDDDFKKFFFLAESFSHFPCEDWKAEMVAHELAHACLFAIGSMAHSRPWPRSSSHECAEIGSQREQEVSTLLVEWGRPVSCRHEILAWCQETEFGTNNEAVNRSRARYSCAGTVHRAVESNREK
jgi:hypothetical protein